MDFYTPRSGSGINSAVPSRYGVVLAKDRSHDLAIEWLLKSVFLYPWNWGAWLELSCLIRDVQHVRLQNSSTVTQ